MSGLVYFGNGGGGGGGGEVKFLSADVGGNIPPDANGVINIHGGANIFPTVGAGTTITISLTDSIHLPNTNGTGTEGALWLGAAPGTGVGGTIFLHNHGTDNTFLGIGANSNLTDTGAENVGIGSGSMSVIGAASQCTALGHNSLHNLNDGTDNTAIGDNALVLVTDGVGNIALGSAAGSATGANSNNNICIQNIGAVESNTIRIGTVGTHTANYQAGIYGNAPAAALPVVINANGELGTSIAVGGSYGFQVSTDADYQLTGAGNLLYYAGLNFPLVVNYNPTGVFDPGILAGLPGQHWAMYNVPVNGLYSFKFNLELLNYTVHNATDCRVVIYKHTPPAPPVRYAYTKNSPWMIAGNGFGNLPVAADGITMSITTEFYLLAGDIIQFYFAPYGDQAIPQLLTVGRRTNISGYLVHV